MEKKSLRDLAISNGRKFGRRADKALWVAKRASLLAGFATAAAMVAKYGAKLFVKVLTRH